MILALIPLLACTSEHAALAESFGDADLSAAGDVAEWSTLATAVAAYNLPVTGYVLAAFSIVDDDCPVIDETDTSFSLEGGCTDSEGGEWTGSMVLEGTDLEDDNGEIESLSYDDLQVLWTGTGCDDGPITESYSATGGATYDDAAGEFTTTLSMTFRTYDTDLCDLQVGSLAYDYAGSWSGGDRTTWNGSGTIGVEGQGHVTATTTDEVQDNSVCTSEPLSGNLTLGSGGDEAVVSFNGAADCDDDATGTWTLNGADQGELSGVGYQCATASPRGLGWLGAIWLGMGLLARRRQSPW